MVEMNWEGANTAPEIEATQPLDHYHNFYCPQIAIDKVVGNVKSFRKITYKNVYPLIDMEYTIHPEEGIKYSYILHPGADPSKIKMHYTGAKIVLDPNKNLQFITSSGKMTDHAPLTYVGQQSSSNVIGSEFAILDKNIIGFNLANGNLPVTQTTVIDPWQVGPSFPSNGSFDSWTPNDLSVDGSGNVFVYSINSGVFGGQQINKFNSAGAVQWTFDLVAKANYGTYQGDVAADPAGNSYVCIGLGPSTTTFYNTIKINPTGTALVWGTSTGSTGTNYMYETWTITFNCNYTQFYQSGGGRLPSGTTYYNVSVEEPVNSATGTEGTAIEK